MGILLVCLIQFSVPKSLDLSRLDKDSVPARVTLGVTTLLTMTTQASGNLQN